MQIGMELRRLAAGVKQSSYDRCRGSHRLTVLALGDLPGHVGFTLWEARARGWAPVVAGRVSSDDELTVTFRVDPSSGYELLSTFLNDGRLPATNPVPTDPVTAPSQRVDSRSRLSA